MITDWWNICSMIKEIMSLAFFAKSNWNLIEFLKIDLTRFDPSQIHLRRCFENRKTEQSFDVELLDFKLNFGFLYKKCCHIIIRKPLTNSNMKHYQFSDKFLIFDRIKNDPKQLNEFDTKDLWWHLLGNVRAKVYISVDLKIIHCKDVSAKAFTYSLEAKITIGFDSKTAVFIAVMSKVKDEVWSLIKWKKQLAESLQILHWMVNVKCM